MNKKSHLEYLYKCPTTGEVNNGLLPTCNFEMVFEEGDYNCPLCGHPLVRVPSGPSVSELLRRGQLEEQARDKK